MCVERERERERDFLFLFNLNMGCVASKPTTCSFYLPLPCLKGRTSSSNHKIYGKNADDDLDSRHVVSLTSSSYGLLNTDGAPSQGSFLRFQANPSKYQPVVAEHDNLYSPGLDQKHLVAYRRMVPLKDKDEEDSLLLSMTGMSHVMETINTWELMDGLEDGCRNAQAFSANSGLNKLRLLNRPRSLDFMPTQYSASRPMLASCELPQGHLVSDVGFADSISLVRKKDHIQPETMKQNLHLSGTSAQQASPSSQFDRPPRPEKQSCETLAHLQRKSPSCGSLAELRDSKSSSSKGDTPVRSSSGLKLLISPGNSQSYYVSRLPKRGSLHVTSLSFDGKTERLQIRSADQRYGSPGAKRKSRQQSMESSKSSDMQLFDPTLIATFERALETSQNSSDEWRQQSMDESTTNSSSSDKTWPASEMASDAESGWNVVNQEKPSIDAITSSTNREKEDATRPLDAYELRCPPQGIDKVVLYYTSLRGVRKTYEDCCTVRLILKGLGVHVEERDLWMHSQYKEELRLLLGDLLEGLPLVPRLFIKGRYIGGAEVVKRLHEVAKLTSLMGDMAMGAFRNVCTGCGDVRFVPCLNCSGSCKVHTQLNEVLRCPACNENGLIMCPLCTV